MHDASLFVKNVQFCAKQKGMKTGELERSVGVRLGYLSRWSSGRQTSAPTLDIACRLADAVGESLSDLVSADYAEIFRISNLKAELKKKQEEISGIKRELECITTRKALAESHSLTDEMVREYLHDLKDA